MENSINSITTILPELLRLYNNIVQSYEKISEAVISDKDTITLDLLQNDDSIKSVSVPTFGNFKNRLDRIDESFTRMGSDTSTVSLRLADGSYRKLVLSEIKHEPDSLTSINSVNQFKSKVNNFFDNLIDPNLYIELDLTGQVPIDIERIQTSKFILDLNTNAKINWFKDNYKGKSDVVYLDFLKDVIVNNITYALDERVVDVPPRELRFIGDFNVIRIEDTTVEETINDVVVVKKRKSYKLNKISYTDTRADFDDTMSLKLGDSLIVNTSPKDTRYKIVAIDSSTNSVTLELIEGLKSVKIGVNVLKFYSEKDIIVSSQIPIGFNERNVLFVKPIDPDSELPSKNWSPGSGFYTNELKINLDDGEIETLEDYYRDEVTDLSVYLLGLAKERIPPSTLGIKPDAPVLSSTDFSVVQINSHITKNTALEEIEKLQKEKNELDAEIKELDKAIANKREKLALDSSSNSVKRRSDDNELKALIEERNAKSELYSSIVTEIDTLTKNENLIESIPKYRVRGFFPFPDLKYTKQTGYQQIIQFEYSYRYLSKDGSANPVEHLTYEDGDSEKRGAFTNWVVKRSQPRGRQYNENLNEYEWVPVNVENADEYNINSIDIAINTGEIVELRVKSISEAGYPTNPITSEYSESVRVEFPDNINTISRGVEIIEENKLDITKVKLHNELRSIGIYSHVQNSFVHQNKYYPHIASEIASGFLTEEQAPISVFDKLIKMSNDIQELNAILKKAKGVLVAKLTDDEGNVVLLKRNQLNKIFAGYYYDEVEPLEIKKGVIITKTFFLTVENTEATTLELISRVPGTYTRQVKASEPSGITYATGILPASYEYYDNNDTTLDGNPTYDTNDSDYNTNKRYDLAPIVLSNPTNNDSSISVAFPYQASQVKSQFVFCRYKDIASEDTFYSYDKPTVNGSKSVDIAPLNTVNTADDAEYYYDRVNYSTSTSSNNFIWGGSFNMDAAGIPYSYTNYENTDAAVDVHVDHPYALSSSAFIQAYERITSLTLTPPVTGVYDATSDAAQLFRQSRFAKLEAQSVLGKKQNLYLFDKSVSDPTAISSRGITPSNIVFDRTVKTSFEENDQYLLGKYSCGSYLFLATDSHESICVDGKSLLSKVNLLYGSENSIRVPIIFQYRMSDYWGEGSTGTGNVGGDTTGGLTNITYSKRIGVDFYDVDKNTYSYDIEVSAKYKSDNLRLEQLPVRSLQVAVDDVKKTISSLSPKIVETRVKNENEFNNR